MGNTIEIETIFFKILRSSAGGTGAPGTSTPMRTQYGAVPVTCEHGQDDFTKTRSKLAMSSLSLYEYLFFSSTGLAVSATHAAANLQGRMFVRVYP